MTEIKEQDQHHWSGWPGACCLKCFADDPMEEALADGRAYFEEEAGEDPKLKFTSPEVEAEIVKRSICPMKGVLRWNTEAGKWDLLVEGPSIDRQ